MIYQKFLPSVRIAAVSKQSSTTSFIQRMNQSSNMFFLRKYLSLQSSKIYYLIRLTAAGIFGYSIIDPSFAGLADGGMKTAVVELQQEILGSGWITVGKIAAAAVGAVMAIARSSAVPFAMGGAVSGGLHFFQKHTEAAAACLL